MNYPEFLSQMNRLGSNYGGSKSVYTQDRMEIFWVECRGFSNQRFTDMITEMIGTFRTPPMLKEFRDMAAKVREKMAFDDQQEMKQASSKFMSDEDVGELFKALRDKLNGKISKEEFDARMEVLKRAVAIDKQNNPPPCCTDGMVGARSITTGNLFAFRCGCQKGQQYPGVPPWAGVMQHRYELEV